MPDIFDSLYYPDERDRVVFGDRYCPPEKFSHGDWHKVAVYEKGEGGDGQTVEIDESRLPARFFRIRGLPSQNSIGEPVPGFEVTTGSSMEKLAHEIALAASEGMLCVHSNKE